MAESWELEREINIKDIEWKTEAPDWTVKVKAVIEVTTPAQEPSFVRLLFETDVKELLVESHDDLPEWIMNLLADRFRRPLPTNMHD